MTFVSSSISCCRYVYWWNSGCWFLCQSFLCPSQYCSEIHHRVSTLATLVGNHIALSPRFSWARSSTLLNSFSSMLYIVHAIHLTSTCISTSSILYKLLSLFRWSSNSHLIFIFRAYQPTIHDLDIVMLPHKIRGIPLSDNDKWACSIMTCWRHLVLLVWWLFKPNISIWPGTFLFDLYCHISCLSKSRKVSHGNVILSNWDEPKYCYTFPWNCWPKH